MKLMIIGHGRHGKDTVAEIIDEVYGLTYVSSSQFCAESVVYPLIRKCHEDDATMFDLATPPLYSKAHECFEDRHSHRAWWYEAIQHYNTPDKTSLGRAIFNEYDIYAGIRSKTEFHALRNNRVFDYAIWVDRSDHLPPEDKASCSVEPWMADFVIDNNFTESDLRRNVVELIERLRSG